MPRPGRPLFTALFVFFVVPFVYEAVPASTQDSPVAEGSSVAPRQSPIPSRSLVAQDLSGPQEPRKGYLIDEKNRPRASDRTVTITVPAWVIVGLTLPVLAYLIVWRRRRRRDVRERRQLSAKR